MLKNNINVGDLLIWRPSKRNFYYKGGIIIELITKIFNDDDSKFPNQEYECIQYVNLITFSNDVEKFAQKIITSSGEAWIGDRDLRRARVLQDSGWSKQIISRKQ